MQKAYMIICLIGILSLQAFAQQTIFFDDFEDGTFNPQYWELKPGVNNGLIDIQQGSTPDGFFRVRIGKSSDAGGDNTNALCLYLDLSGYENVALEFWISDFNDNNGPFDEIRISDDSAATSVEAFQFSPDDWNDNLWGMLPPIDISGIAKEKNLELNDQFVIIFRQQGTGDFNSSNGIYDGFFLDAVHVYDPQHQYTTPPYSNGFESSSFDQVLTWTNPAYPAPGTSNIAFINPMGLVGRAEDANAPQGNWVMRTGRRYDGGNVAGAFDIHLNIANEDELELKFWINDFYDEDHFEDGIFLSDDGGMTFVKVYPFLPNSWNNNFWGKLPPIDLDNLIRDHNLTFSDSFIVRFQQRGSGDFNTSNGIMDGLMFDNIQISNPNLVYANVTPDLPFVENFESGMGNMWHWGDPFYPDTSAEDGARRPGGDIGVTQARPHDGFWSAYLGRRNDGSSTTNALDLLLNLAGAVNVQLDFWVADNYDETGPSDGVWLSVDGGQNFTQIYQFTPSTWVNLQYNNLVVQVSDSAIAHGLTLSERSVIRLQQNGTGDFNTSNGIADGFWIDDVVVTMDSLTVLIEPDRDPASTTDFALYQNYPNPFNPSTTIHYRLAKSARVDLKIYDQLGQLVQTLVNAEQPAGTYEVQWDGKNQGGARASSGIYFYRITTGSWQETRKMLLIQ